MQLAGWINPELRPGGGRRSLTQKWKQIQAARALEEQWTKQEILEAYLNLVSFRGELQGIDAAARGLFDKQPSGLSEAELLVLAALLRAPGLASMWPGALVAWGPISSGRCRVRRLRLRHAST